MGMTYRNENSKAIPTHLYTCVTARVKVLNKTKLKMCHSKTDNTLQSTRCVH